MSMVGPQSRVRESHIAPVSGHLAESNAIVHTFGVLVGQTLIEGMIGLLLSPLEDKCQHFRKNAIGMSPRSNTSLNEQPRASGHNGDRCIRLIICTCSGLAGRHIAMKRR